MPDSRGALKLGSSAQSQGVELGALWSTRARAHFLLPFLWPSRTSDSGSNFLRRRLILVLLITRRPTRILRFKTHIFFLALLSLPVFPSSSSVSDLWPNLKLSRSERVQAGQGGRVVQHVSVHSSAEGGLSLGGGGF